MEITRVASLGEMGQVQTLKHFRNYSICLFLLLRFRRTACAYNVVDYQQYFLDIDSKFSSCLSF